MEENVPSTPPPTLSGPPIMSGVLRSERHCPSRPHRIAAKSGDRGKGVSLRACREPELRYFFVEALKLQFSIRRVPLSSSAMTLRFRQILESVACSMCDRPPP